MMELDARENYLVSAIVPTIGRPESLRKLLESLRIQTHQINEVIVADGSGSSETRQLLSDPKWRAGGLAITRIDVQPPNAVRQREAAIALAKGNVLLMLDDDVELAPDCLAEMIRALAQHPTVVAVFADISNQKWPQPTLLWKLYLRVFHGLREGEWNGRVIGPLLRFGYNPVPDDPQPIEWLGAGFAAIRKNIYLLAGGFSDFFLHRSTTNEDVDLSIKLRKHGMIMFAPTARMALHHAPNGRLTPAAAAEDDLHNRFFILCKTAGLGNIRAFVLVVVYFLVETSSHFLGCLARRNFAGFLAPLRGRLRAIRRLLMPALTRTVLALISLLVSLSLAEAAGCLMFCQRL